jgi:hypothetical protein
MVSVPVSVDWVNDAPTIESPDTINVSEGVLTEVSSINVYDVDVTETLGGTVSVTLTCVAGTLSLNSRVAVMNGVYFTIGDGSVAASTSISGPVDGVNMVLETLSYLAPINLVGAQDSITVSTSDNGFRGIDSTPLITTKAVAIVIAAVNNAPSVAFIGVSLPVNVNENGAIFIKSQVSDTDLGSSSLPLEVTVTSTYGTLAFSEPADVVYSPTADLHIQQISLRGDATRSFVEEVQAVTSSATVKDIGGYFTLKFLQEPTIILHHDASDSDVQDALNGLSVISNCQVSRVTLGFGYVWRVTFSLTDVNLYNMAFPLLSADITSMTGHWKLLYGAHFK